MVSADSLCCLPAGSAAARLSTLLRINSYELALPSPLRTLFDTALTVGHRKSPRSESHSPDSSTLRALAFRVPPPIMLPLRRDAECAATGSAIDRARSAPAVAARDDTPRRDAESNSATPSSGSTPSESAAINGPWHWQARYDFQKRCTVYIQHQSRQVRYTHPDMQVPTQRTPRHSGTAEWAAAHSAQIRTRTRVCA